MQLVYLGGALLVAGCIAGVSAGLFGIGGGAIMVPVLFYTFTALGYDPSVTMHLALATSASVIVVTSIRSANGHNKKGAVDWDLIWPSNLSQSWGLWIGVGALIAAWFIAKWLTGQQLTLFFGATMSLIAMQFIFGRPDWRISGDVPKGVAPPIFGTILGGFCGLMGIGFGSIGVTLMLLCGRKIHQAIGTAAAIGFFIGLPASIGYMISGWSVSGRAPFSIGYVNLVGFATMALATIICVPIGVRLAHKLSQEKLRMIFGVFLLLIALNMVRKSLF